MIVATAGVADAHVTWLVRSCVELSEKVPVAVNCCVFPLAMLGLAGVTAIELSVGAAVTITALVVTVLSLGRCDVGTAIIVVIVNVPVVA